MKLANINLTFDILSLSCRRLHFAVQILEVACCSLKFRCQPFVGKHGKRSVASSEYVYAHSYVSGVTGVAANSLHYVLESAYVTGNT